MQQQETDDQVSSGPSMVLCLLVLFIYFVPGCWRQLARTRQATRRFTGHLNWPLCSKETSGLLSAVPGNAAACMAVPLPGTAFEQPGHLFVVIKASSNGLWDGVWPAVLG